MMHCPHGYKQSECGTCNAAKEAADAYVVRQRSRLQNTPSSGESHEDSLKSRDEALRIADALEATHPAVWPYGKEAAAELRRQHAELDKVKQITLNDEALLQQALEALTVATLGSLTGKWKRGEELITAIKERLK